jgi:putative flippase GtrA
MEEFQIWSLYQSARIGNGLMIIASVLIIWLSLRTAIQTRTPVSGEAPNMVAKVLSTAFCLLSVFFVYGIWTFASYNNPVTASALSDLKASGTELTNVGNGFIEFVGTTELTGIAPPAYLFLAVITLMMMGAIWSPKEES